MLQPRHGTLRNIAFLWAHCGAAEDGGNRIYEVAAAVLSPDRPGETFSSPVRYRPFTERERHASGLSREALRDAPSLPDAAAFLGTFLRESNLLLTLNPGEALTPLLAGCGNPRVVDLGFAAEFFLPRADWTSLRTLWEHLQGKSRGKISFSAREAVELSIDLCRHISGRVLDPAQFPPAASLRFYLGRSNTLFGDLFLHLNRNHRAYFGGLFDPSSGSDTPEWKGFLEKAPPRQPLPEGDPDRRALPVARMGDLYRGLASRTKGYALRPSQIAYATEVASALNDRAVLTIEAGTGTGKTQGYLIPLMEFLRRNPHSRAAVSTYTKNLQEQLVRREIPLALSLNRAYRKIPVALLKGKSNHLCAEKLDHLYEETLSGGRLLAWLYFVHRLFHFREADGDAIGGRIRSVLHDGFFFRRLQQEGSARSGCGPRHARCPAQVAAAEAANARLVVTNHHKLALLNRDETLGFLFENCVIDEANHFEQAVRGAFAVEIGSREMADDAAYAATVLGRLAPASAETPRCGIEAAMAALNGLRGKSETLGAALSAVRARAAPGEATVLPPEHPAFADGRLRTHLDDLRKTLREIVGGMAFVKDAEACRRLGMHPRTADRMKTALRAFREHAETLKEIIGLARSPGHVASCTLYRRHWTITVRPVEVAGLLRDHIYSGRECVVFTSATLRQGEGFAGFRRAAGMPEEQANGGSDPADPSAQETGRFRFTAIPSPFPAEAAEISVPPEALSGAFECKEAWLARVSELLPGLIRRNRGRTLVLFASYGDLETVSRRIGEDIQADGFPLLVQRNGVPTASLCDEFREIRESVLFGVDTFWYGVDFPGDTLTQVIITRLPFPHPQDPVQIARRNLLTREEYWKRYRYETEIKLRQGIGRLIRSERDRGKVVILDARYRAMRQEGAAP